MFRALKSQQQHCFEYGFLYFLQFLNTYIGAGRRSWHVSQKALTGPASYIDSVISSHMQMSVWYADAAQDPSEWHIV